MTKNLTRSYIKIHATIISLVDLIDLLIKMLSHIKCVVYYFHNKILCAQNQIILWHIKKSGIWN